MKLVAQGARLDSYALSFSELVAVLQRQGATHAQARVVWQWLYRECGIDFAQLTAVSPAVRAWLSASLTIPVPAVLTRQEAPDGETRKDLLRLADGATVEVVLLRYRERRSACISTQVGCACGCRFCATGQSGWVRDLTAGEIVAQVLHFQRELAVQGQALSHVVIMGMGEPLLNLEATLMAIRRLLDPRGLAFSPRRVTLSTVGIVPGIERLLAERLPVNLAISLHAATDAVRDRLLPINRRYPLAALVAAARAYTETLGRRILFEWVLIDGVNDTPDQARALVSLLSGIPAHVNLIQLNPTPAFEGQPAAPEAVAAFTAILDAAGIPHTMRQRRGEAIAAGCGQLWSRTLPMTVCGVGQSSIDDASVRI